MNTFEFEIGEKVKINFYKTIVIGTIVRKLDNAYEIRHEGSKTTIIYSKAYVHKID